MTSVRVHACGYMPGTRDLLLQLHDPVDQRLGARRASGHEHVHGDDLVHALDDGVVVEDAADRRAGAHRDHPLGFGHLVVDAAHRRRHLPRQAAGDDHQVGLARRAAEDLGAEARDVVAAGRHRHHLDGAAGEAELRRPDRRLPGPVDDLLDRAGENRELVIESVGVVCLCHGRLPSRFPRLLCRFLCRFLTAPAGCASAAMTRPAPSRARPCARRRRSRRAESGRT